MFQCTGFSVEAPDKPLGPFSFNRRNPGARDVQIEILYCGVCHSDLHQARNEWHNTLYPCVPGREIVGRVTKTGAEVTRFKDGDRVGVGCMVDSCRTCASCRAGFEQYCEKGFNPTYNGKDTIIGGPTFGGYSNAIVVDESFVLRIPEKLDLRALPRFSAPASQPIHLCGIGRPGRGRRSALWGLAASAIWA